LEDPKTYSFLTNGNLPVPGVDDAAEFKETVNAMNIMGMTSEDYSGMYYLCILKSFYITSNIYIYINVCV